MGRELYFQLYVLAILLLKNILVVLNWPTPAHLNFSWGMISERTKWEKALGFNVFKKYFKD